MKPKFYLLVLFLCLLKLSGLAQGDSTLNRLVTSLDNYSAKKPIEKVYLQLDKPYYAAGDDIWFKAYVTAGAKHELSGISGVLNVELVGPANTIVQFIKLPLVNGLTWGDFKLADTVVEGNYRIRAYTNWMRNFESEHFFDKTILIGNALPQHVENVKGKAKPAPVPPNLKEVKADPLANTTDVQFFPEGGELVNGIKSQIAFKAVNKSSLGENVKCVIRDEQNNEIAKFSSRHLGMGVFELQPVPNRKYKAHLTFRDGSEKDIDLPVPKDKGYVLHINNANSLHIELRIDASEDLVKSNAGIFLVAQAGGQVYYASKGKTVNAISTAVIPKSKFPSGVAKFTLFSADGEPLNERLIFIRNPDQLNLAVTGPAQPSSPREHINFGLAATTGQDKPALSNLSVVVTDESKVSVDENTETTIYSNLLLTSELKGYIEQPNYYFNEANESAQADLDLLMLTQGYRRFEWKQVLNDPSPVIAYQPEKSLELTGLVKGSNGKPLPDTKVSLMRKTGGLLFLDTATDADGFFAFKNLQFKDSSMFVIQAKEDKKNKVEIDNAGSVPLVPDKRLPAIDVNLRDSLSNYLTNSRKAYTEEVKFGVGSHVRALKEVKIIAQKPKLKNSSNLNGPGNADQVLVEKDLIQTPTLVTSLMGKLTGVHFEWDQWKMAYYPCMYVDGKPARMLVMIDGMKVDAEFLDQLPPEAVESVEVLRRGNYTSVYGNDGYSGVILITTKKGGYGAVSTPNIVSCSPKGYYKARVFYAPQYDDPKINKQMQDLRSTIYWNPNVVTDKHGKTHFDYFNADGPGTYRLVIEGIDAEGHIGRVVYRYKVE